MTLFRAKVYRTVGMPGRPKVTFPIGYGPLRDDRQRVMNHVNFLNETREEKPHSFGVNHTVLQQVSFGL